MAAADDGNAVDNRALNVLQKLLVDKHDELAQSPLVLECLALHQQYLTATVKQMLTDCKVEQQDVQVAKAILFQLTKQREMTSLVLARTIRRVHKLELDGTTGRMHVIDVMCNLKPFVKRLNQSVLSRTSLWSLNVTVEQRFAIVFECQPIQQ